MDKFTMVLAQVNVVVGDISGNATRIIDICSQAKAKFDSELVVFPELALTGYPPEDLLFRGDFIRKAENEFTRIRKEIVVTAIVGHPCRDIGVLYNAASVVGGGKLLARYYKRHLPNYSVFDEKRYFSPGEGPCVFNIDGLNIGLTICEDIWHEGPVEESVKAGANILVNINASPYHIEKANERELNVVSVKAKQSNVPIVYLNMVGGQDELVFDGGSFVSDNAGNITHRATSFDEEIFTVCFNSKLIPVKGYVTSMLSTDASIYKALMIGVRDYVSKNRFRGAIVGLSGGIDSALTLAIAVDALGAENVEAIMMPSRYTRSISKEDAILEAQNLGISYRIVEIDDLFNLFVQQLKPVFDGFEEDTTEENIQARIRGTLLMAISNKTGSIVLTTGNKSEIAVGYSTLYGDMAGGFSAIKDIPKILVYELAKYRNKLSSVIPERVFSRAPSAELAPDQEDQQTLPDYKILDAILELYVESDKTIEDIVAAGFDKETVEDIVLRVNKNEYKRRQSAPGVRISKRAFGRDRRYPITSFFV